MTPDQKIVKQLEQRLRLRHWNPLGQFIEVEINCPEGADTREAQAQVENILSELGGTPLKAGYFEMYVYFHKHEAYQLIPERFQVKEALFPVHSREGIL